jgi:hypothetical protein
VDLGLIGNESLKYLSSILSNEHNLEELAFGESIFFVIGRSM